MKILFSDDDLVVAVKDRGLLSEESNEKENMVACLKEETGSEIYPVHRLDKDVSGVMVYGKNRASASFLSRCITDGSFKKEYIALCHGSFTEDLGRMEDLLFYDKSKGKSFVVKRERKGVKKAILEYEVLSQKEDRALVSVRLLTGRTHQIRVQFASRKKPLFGDRRYGAKDDSSVIALFSRGLSFVHPATGKRVNFTAEPEEDIFKI